MSTSVARPGEPYRLKSERKRSGLTQQELADLLGLSTASAVSRLERGEREPKFRTGLAYEIVFNRSGAELFPVAFNEVENLVLARAAAIADRLRQTTPTGLKPSLGNPLCVRQLD